MDIKYYVIRQLGRTNRKSYEGYVVNRIITLIDDLSIKFVTQQYVTRPDGYALVDLYFPQFNIHVEVDEAQHFSTENIKNDEIRKRDIIASTGHERFYRIDTENLKLPEINEEIDKIVEVIHELRALPNFIKWDIEKEFQPETYINRGYISVNDDVAFRTIADACNCFGHNYNGYQKAGASHPHEPEIMLWFPKLYPNNHWNNSINTDESEIYEENLDQEINNKYIEEHLSGTKTTQNQRKRIVFARVKGNLGDTLYRFKGLYELDEARTLKENRMVWKQTATKVKTFKNN